MMPIEAKMEPNYAEMAEDEAKMRPNEGTPSGRLILLPSWPIDAYLDSLYPI